MVYYGVYFSTLEINKYLTLYSYLSVVIKFFLSRNFRFASTIITFHLTISVFISIFNFVSEENDNKSIQILTAEWCNLT